MGNCNSIEKNNVGCFVCNNEIDMKYVYCAYCNERYHIKCIKSVKYNGCINCTYNFLRLIDRTLSFERTLSLDKI